MRMTCCLLGSLVIMAAATGVRAQDATAELVDGDGATIGTVELTQLAQGVQIVVEAEGLPPGTHGLHIHETGACEPPFESAGGHFNPADAGHGWNNPEGHHAGDLPNVHIEDDGVLTLEFLTDAVTLEEGGTSLFDDDGSAIVIHEGVDDYQSDPSGEAGDRIACGVVTSAN